MIKYDYLEQQANDFIKAVKQATEQATNNDDLDTLCNIVAGVVYDVPTRLMVVDAVDRYTVQKRADRTLSTAQLDSAMRFLVNDNRCKLVNDDLDIQDALDFVNEIETKD